MRTEMKRIFARVSFLLLLITLFSTALALAWQQTSGPGGGIIIALAIDPTNGQTIFAGTNRGGVFKTVNGGSSWIAMNSGITGMNVTSMAIDSTNSQNVYAGTQGGGVYKSVSGGGSWSAANTGLTSNNVFALAIDPTDPTRQTIYAGTSDSGVFKSVNGGGSWTAVNTGLTDKPSTYVGSLAIDSTGAVYAGTYLGRVFKSVNGGASWGAINTGLPGLPVSSLVVGAAGAIYAGTQGGGVFKSVNGGSLWSAVNAGLPASGTIYALAIDPSDVTRQTIYAGIRIQLSLSPNAFGAYKSINGGASWSAVNTGLPNASALSMAINPTGVVYAGTDGVGVFTSSNGGSSWNSVSSGLSSSYENALAIDPTNSQTVYAATMGSGVFKSIDGGATWNTANTGLTSTSVQQAVGTSALALAIDPTDSTGKTIYTGVLNGGVFKSTNGGNSWNAVNTGLLGLRGLPASISSLAIDPAGVVYAGGLKLSIVGATAYGVFKTVNGGASWIGVNTGLPLTDVYQNITSLIIDPTDSTDQTIYAGTASNGVFKTITGGASWSAVNTGLTGSYIYSLAIDPSGVIYAGTRSFGVFKSTTGGASWIAINTGLDYSPIAPSTNIVSLAIDPSNSQNIYAGTDDRGVFKSTNGGSSWSVFNSGLTSTFVSSLAATTNGTIYAGTYGRGVFK